MGCELRGALMTVFKGTSIGRTIYADGSPPDRFVHTTVAQKDGVEHPVSYQVTLGGGEHGGVLIEFPDGRSLSMSIFEWIAIGVHAVEAASHTQDIAETMRRRATDYQLSEIRYVVAGLLQQLDRRKSREGAAVEVAEACVDWAADTGDCHFCGDYARKSVHDDDPPCPLIAYLELSEKL